MAWQLPWWWETRADVGRALASVSLSVMGVSLAAPLAAKNTTLASCAYTATSMVRRIALSSLLRNAKSLDTRLIAPV
jgi:hypothetical protein